MRKPNWLQTGLIVILALAILVVIVPAHYSRYMADDYCVAAPSKTMGLVEALKSALSSFSGKYTHTTVLWALGKLPPGSLGWIVLAVCLVWALLLTDLFKRLTKLAGNNLSTAGAISLSLVTLLATFQAAPNLFQDLFWMTGLVGYTMPLILFTLTVDTALWALGKQPFSYLCLVPLAMLSILACGSGEAVSIAQIVFYGSCLLLLIIDKKVFSKPRLVVSLALLVVSVIAVALQYLTPGNQARASVLSNDLSLPQLLFIAFRSLAHLYAKLLVFSPYWVLLALGLGAGLGIVKNRNANQIAPPLTARAVFYALAANLLISLGVCLTIAYFMAAYPDDRIIYIPYYLAMLTIAWFAYRFGENWRPTQTVLKLAPYLMLVLSISSLIFSIAYTRRDLPAYISFAERWDAREQRIKASIASGERTLTLPGLEARYQVSELQYDPDSWINSCMADYYGVDAIIGK